MANDLTLPKDTPLVGDNIFGPDMRKLPIRERLFVCLMFEGARNQTDAVVKAGFGPYKSRNAASVKACHLMQDTRIKAAFIEESRRRSVVMLPTLEKALRAMVANPQHQDHFKAVKLAYEQSGVTLAHEVNVNVNVTHTEPEKVAQMRQWAAEMNRKGMNIDIDKLIGTQVVDAEFAEVGHDNPPLNEPAIEDDDELMALR